MRGFAVAALLGLCVACSNTVETAPPSTVTPSSLSSTTAAPPSTTSTTTTTTPPSTTTTAPVDGPPSVDMVPTGYEIEDFIPLVEGYFAVCNWALEHPDQVTEDILATVIEPDSVEMRDTLAEIQDLLDQDAHHEGLTETFVLVAGRFARTEADPDLPPTDVVITIEYGASHVVTGQASVLSTDTLRRAPWTLTFDLATDNSWSVSEVLRNPFDHAPASP